MNRTKIKIQKETYLIISYDHYNLNHALFEQGKNLN